MDEWNVRGNLAPERDNGITPDSPVLIGAFVSPQQGMDRQH
jgi:hypothetical protein